MCVYYMNVCVSEYVNVDCGCKFVFRENIMPNDIWGWDIAGEVAGSVSQQRCLKTVTIKHVLGLCCGGGRKC